MFECMPLSEPSSVAKEGVYTLEKTMKLDWRLQQQPLVALLILSSFGQGHGFSLIKEQQQRPSTVLRAFASNSYLQGLADSSYVPNRRRTTQAYLESLTRSSAEIKPRETPTSLGYSTMTEVSGTESGVSNDFHTTIVGAAAGASSTMTAYAAQVAAFEASSANVIDVAATAVPESVDRSAVYTDTQAIVEELASVPKTAQVAVDNVAQDATAAVDKLQETTALAASAVVDNLPEPDGDSMENIVTQSQDMWTRIAMATDYAMDNKWKLEDLKVSKVAADLAENSQTSLQLSHVELSSALEDGTGQSQTILENSVKALVNAETQVLESTKETLKLVTKEMSVGELSDRVVKGLATLGELAVAVLNVIMEAVSGQTVASVTQAAQETAVDAIVDAVATVVVMAEKFGDQPVAQVLQTTLNLVVTISRVLFRIFNSVVQMVTGKSVPELGQVAAQSFEKETSKILEAAFSTGGELSQKSLRELIVMLGQFEVETAETIMKTATKAMETVKVGVNSDDAPSPVVS